MKSLIKRSPFGTPSFIDTDSVFSQMDSLLRDTFGVLNDRDSDSLTVFEQAAYPRLDIRDEPTQVVVDVEVPGHTKEDIKIEVIDNVLIVRGEKNKSLEEKKGTYLRRELKRSSFSRQVCRFDESYCETDKIDATFKDGLLTIVVPKKKIEPPKQNVRSIQIK